jgi:hypothetical protein
VATQEGGLEICPLSPIQPEQPLNVLPKLIRIAAIGLVGLIGYKGVQTLIAPPPPIDQQKLEKKVEEEGKEGERRHQEEMEGFKAMRVALASKYGVSPDVLRPLFENLGMIGLTPDQIREMAPEAIKAILARANEIDLGATGDARVGIGAATPQPLIVFGETIGAERKAKQPSECDTRQKEHPGLRRGKDRTVHHMAHRAPESPTARH